MATITTKAIVLSSLKYSDTSLIVKCYTEQEGIKSYIIKGVLKAKKGGIKVAYFQPLTQLILVDEPVILVAEPLILVAEPLILVAESLI